MKHFLLVYDRKTGHLDHQRFDTGASAYEAYCRTERERANDKNTEVVLLSAPSFDALRATHGNYFAPESSLFPSMPLMALRR